MRALARASYRALVRSIASGSRGVGNAETRASFAPRARAVLRQRVGAIVRGEIARLRATDEASEAANTREFIARCAVATAFFRDACVGFDSAAAAHARASVGYEDGARRRRRRASAREPSRRERRSDEVRKIVAWWCDEGPFGTERARAIGMSEGLTPPRA